MKRKKKAVPALLAGLMVLLTAWGNAGQTPREASYSVTEGTQEYRGFTLDNVLHSETEGDIHFNLYVPDSYDGSHPTSIFFTLPGYEGLYFQGTGENLYQEDFGFTAQEYDCCGAPAFRLGRGVRGSDHCPGGIFFCQLQYRPAESLRGRMLRGRGDHVPCPWQNTGAFYRLPSVQFQVGRGL